MELEDYGVFIKLVEEEYVEDILNGNLHFSSLKSFSELEEKQAGGIADKNEGVMNVSIPMANAFIRLRSGNRENEIMPLHDIKARINFSITEEQKKSTGICCFMYLPLSKFDCKKEENIIKASFGKKLREHILNFLNSTEDEKGKKCEIMMVDSVDLIELLTNNKLAYGPVYYYDNYNFDKTIDFINTTFFMYFSGKVPLTVAGTSPAVVSSGLGITVKLSAESGPSFEQDVMNSTEAADNKRRFFFCITL